MWCKDQGESILENPRHFSISIAFRISWDFCKDGKSVCIQIYKCPRSHVLHVEKNVNSLNRNWIQDYCGRKRASVSFFFFLFAPPKWPLHCSISRITPIPRCGIFFLPTEIAITLERWLFTIPNGTQICESFSDAQTHTVTATHRRPAIRSPRTKWIFRILFLLFWRNREYGAR